MQGGAVIRYISRLTGEPIKFKNKEQYDAHLEELRQKGQLTRDRSRRTRPDVSRDKAWRSSRQPLNNPPRRFQRPDAPQLDNYPRWTFSLIHPTRERPAPCRQCMYMWMDHCSPHNDLEYVLSLDSNNAHVYLKVIIEMSGQTNLQVLIGENENVVQALNRGAAASSGNVLIYVSDDFECMPNWDLEIQKAVRGKGKEDDWVLFVYDGIQKQWQTISILSRGYYKRTGYIYHPGYISMFADPDYTETARLTGRVIDGTHLTFNHNHCTVGGLPFDGVYARQNSTEAWNHGERLFSERAERNFDL